MGTEKCPFCGQEIDSAATRCFFCGAELSEESVHKRLEQLHEQDERFARRPRSPFAAGLIVVVILIGIVLFYDNSGRKPVSYIDNPYQSSTIRLKAKIAFPEAGFIITNDDSFDWQNVKLELMPESTEDSFSLKVPNISAGETYTVTAAEFSRADGVRFDLYKMKPKKLLILCDTPNNKSGSYYLEW